jgi:hypothetical protein
MVAPLPMASMQAMPLMNVTNNVPIAFNQPAVEVQRQVLQKQLDGACAATNSTNMSHFIGPNLVHMHYPQWLLNVVS